MRLILSLICIIVLSCVGLLNLLSIISSSWNHDSGLHLSTSATIASGFIPYLDFKLQYTPLVFLINSIPIRLGFDRLGLSIVLPFAWIICSCFSISWMAFRYSKSILVAFIAALALLLNTLDNGGNGMVLEHGVVLFASLALGFACDPQKKVNLFFSGVFLSFAVLSKQIGLVFLMPILVQSAEGLDSFSQGYKRLFLFGLGALLPGLAILTWVNFDLVSLWNNFVLFFRVDAARELELSWSFAGRNEMIRSPFTFCFTVLSFVCGFLNLLVATFHKEWKRVLWVLSFIVVSFILISTRYYRNYYHYQLNALPALTVLIIIQWKSMSNRGGSLFGVLAAVLFFFGYLLNVSTLVKSKYFDRWHEPLLAEVFAPAAVEIRKLTSASDRILVIGEENIVEFLSGRLPQSLSHYWYEPYDSFPDLGNVTVLADKGHNVEQMKAKRISLIERGYGVVYKQIHPLFQIEIFVKKLKSESDVVHK